MTHDFTLEFSPTTDLRLQREVDLSPSAIWRAWTEPGLLKQWFSPRPWTVSHCEMDLFPGGKFRTVMNGPAGEVHDSTGCFLEVVPEKRLVFTDAFKPGFRPSENQFMTGVILLEPAGVGTKYTAVARHRDAATKEQHEQMGFHTGWSAALDQLVELMRTER